MFLLCDRDEKVRLLEGSLVIRFVDVRAYNTTCDKWTLEFPRYGVFEVLKTRYLEEASEGVFRIVGRDVNLRCRTDLKRWKTSRVVSIEPNIFEDAVRTKLLSMGVNETAITDISIDFGSWTQGDGYDFSAHKK